MSNYLRDGVQDTLRDAGIVRTDREVEDALDWAASEWSGRNLRAYATSAEIYNSTERWWRFLHEEHGVFDYLGIDAEEDANLYDREKGN